MSKKNLLFKVTAKYANEPALGLWVPVELVQLFDLSSAGYGDAGGGIGSKQWLEGRIRSSNSAARRIDETGQHE